MPKEKIAYRTTMPFARKPLGEGPSISPSTQRSVMPFNNVHTVQDVLEGRPYRLPGGGGSWSQDDLSNQPRGERGERGEDYKRKERDKEILLQMTNMPSVAPEKWKVKVPGGSKTFMSFDMANAYKQKLKEKGYHFTYVTRIAQQNQQVEIVADVMQSVFKVESINLQKGFKEVGSAFCVAPKYFVTCAHVIQEYDKKQINEQVWIESLDGITVNLIQEGRNIQSQIVGWDLEKDLALLQTNVNVPPLRLDPEATTGESIFTVGSPHGFENNVSSGRLGSTNRIIYKYENAPEFMFVDMSIFTGNSGGPIIREANGSVIGIIVLVISEDGEYGLNAGVNSSYIRDFIEKFNLPV